MKEHLQLSCYYPQSATGWIPFFLSLLSLLKVALTPLSLDKVRYYTGLLDFFHLFSYLFTLFSHVFLTRGDFNFTVWPVGVSQSVCALLWLWNAALLSTVAADCVLHQLALPPAAGFTHRGPTGLRQVWLKHNFFHSYFQTCFSFVKTEINRRVERVGLTRKWVARLEHRC